jgi:flagellar biosynthesis protein FliR
MDGRWKGSGPGGGSGCLIYISLPISMIEACSVEETSEPLRPISLLIEVLKDLAMGIIVGWVLKLLQKLPTYV